MTFQDNPSEPQTVGEARDAVERSRERISDTLDRLEDRIVEKKHALQDRADVFRPVKRQVRLRPLAAIAIGFGIGVMLGRAGGKKRSADGQRARRGRIRRHEVDDSGRRARPHAPLHDDEPDDAEGRSSRLDGVKSQLIGAVTSALTAAIASGVKDYMRDRSHGRADARVS